MLESHGYRLRQRYKPDWTPSWLNSKSPPPLHEDYAAHWVSHSLLFMNASYSFHRTPKSLMPSESQMDEECS